MSSGWKDAVKSGWQQGKDGTSSLRNQVKGLVNRDDNTARREPHVAAPRSSLRDPSSFGPPPKHVAAYRPGAAQTASSQAVAAAPATTSAGHQQQLQRVEEPPAEPRPYQVDRTGLSTSHFPPPPPRPSAYSPKPTATATSQVTTTAKPVVPPPLPPRLPPRSENNIQRQGSTDAQAASHGYLNQGAISNLGAAGISVPGLGIGGNKTPSPQPPSYGQVDELQARFARMEASPIPMGSGGGIRGTTQQHSVPSIVGKTKPPPPPVPKKPAVSRTGEDTNTPPPVPLATRPKFD